jgi:hypothetical protein
MLFMGSIGRSSLISFVCTLLVYGFSFAELSGGSLAQSLTGSAPVLGGSGGLRPPAQSPVLNGVPNATVKIHLGPTGKPCITVLGSALPQTINPNIFNHMISANNVCSQRIEIRVCYYRSQQCISFIVPAYGSKEEVIGIMPAMNQFQFEYRERFDAGMSGLGNGFN